MMLDRNRAVVVVIDVQEGFRSYSCFEKVAAACGRLVAGARVLDVPVLATEQYPQGLGATADAVGLDAGGGAVVPVAKVAFSACRADGFELPAGRDQILLCGIEAHVCVAQTALDLLDGGHHVFLVEDAAGSRHKRDRRTALRRLAQEGCIPVTVEAALLELCRAAGSAEFKAVQGIIK